VTTNEQQGVWLKRMNEAVVTTEDDPHRMADDILREIAIATGHGYIVSRYDEVPKWWDG
jgi:hypothetical protein